MWDKIFKAISDRHPEKPPIRDFSDLQEHEKATFTNWQAILTAQELSLNDIKRLLATELEKAELESESYDNSQDKDRFLKAYKKVCRLILTAIEAPGQQREHLKDQLRTLYGVDI